LSELSGFADLRDFQRAHRQWVEQTVENGRAVRDDHWSQAIAIGSLAFVESVKSELGSRAMHRAVEQNRGQIWGQVFIFDFLLFHRQNLVTEHQK